jgi:2-oxoglutarate dehydrogenase E2 component (dihydrolipoamide succinyltransferase)
MPTQVIMPQLGESVVEGTVLRWLKREGDPITALEPLLEVSTDKVDTEVPAPADGVLLKILIPEGTTVEKGTLLAVIGQAGEQVADDGDNVGARHAVPLEKSPVPAPAQVSANGQPANGGYTGHVTPVVARMAAEHQLDLAQIQGTGRDGRVTRKDVEAYLENTGAQRAAPLQNASDDLPPWEQPGSGDLFKPTVDYSIENQPSPPSPLTGEGRKSGAPVTSEGSVGARSRAPSSPSPDVGAQRTAPSSPAPAALPRLHPVEAIPDAAAGELVALSPMRRQIAEHMVMSKHTSPHVTTVFEIDLSAVVAHREANKEAFAKQGVNLTLTAYFVAATVEALRAMPTLNAKWTDEGIFLHRAMNIGVAVALEQGLIVPVIKGAQDYNLLGLARAVNDLAARARAKQLKPDEVRDGTFTITNHGVSGSLFATPIINQPQVGILGVGVMEKRVKVITDAAGSDSLSIRPCCYVSLTFDHRVADGAVGDGFLLTLKRRLESWT